MRLALVTETFPPDVNGVSFTLDRLARGLAARGHTVSVWRAGPVPDNGADLPFHLHGLPSLPVPRYPGLRMGRFSIPSLLHAWRHDPPDALYIATEGPLGIAAVGVARLLGIPFGTGHHTNFTSYLPAYGLGWLAGPAAAFQRRLHARGAFTMVPSRSTAESLADTGYERLVVVGRGVDTDLFHPDKRSADLRREWNAHPWDAVVLLAGRVAREKNLPLALEAIQSRRSRGARVLAVVAGDGPFLAECRRRWPWAIFTGELPRPNLAAVAASCDLFAFPSLTETFGNVLLEAMASGLPAVAFDRAAAREHLRHGVSGWLAPAADPIAFARLLGRAILTPEPERRAMGEAARLTALALTWNAVVARFESLLARTAAGAAPLESTASDLHPLVHP